MERYTVPLEVFPRERYPRTSTKDMDKMREEWIVKAIEKVAEVECEYSSAFFGVHTDSVLVPPKIILTLHRKLDELCQLLGESKLRIMLDQKNYGLRVEIPSTERRKVLLGALLEDQEMLKDAGGCMTIPLGWSADNSLEVLDLDKHHAVLVTGDQGVGRTTFLHDVINSLVYRCSPEQVRFLLIDHGGKAFQRYAGLPHLQTYTPITDALTGINALAWLNKECKDRMHLFHRQAKRVDKEIEDIEQYNESLSSKQTMMPHIVVVIDELADLAKVYDWWAKKFLYYIAEYGKPYGIHLVCAAVNGGEGEDFFARWEGTIPRFVMAKEEEGTEYLKLHGTTLHISQSGACLLRDGDGVFVATQYKMGIRVQTPWIDEVTIENVVDCAKEQWYGVEDRLGVRGWPRVDVDDFPDVSLRYAELSDGVLAALWEWVLEAEANGGLVRRKSYTFDFGDRPLDELIADGFLQGCTWGSEPNRFYMTREGYKQLFGLMPRLRWHLDVLEFVMEEGTISPFAIQRRFGAKGTAVREVMDWMTERRYITPWTEEKGSKLLLTERRYRIMRTR